jgi:transcriptional regulator with XRE-family HTH domain
MYGINATEVFTPHASASNDAVMEWRHQILRLMVGAGLNQTQLAERIGVGQSQISKWVNGTRTPDADQMLTLARALDVRVGELYGDADALPDRPTPAELDLLRIARRIGIEAALDRILLVEGREVEDVTDGTILRGDHPARPVAGRERRA